MASFGSNTARRGRIGAEGPEFGSMAIGLLVTALLHAGLVGAFVLQNLLGPESKEPDEPPETMEFEDVELLKLGEKKPKNELPRISNPPPPKQKKETVDLDPKQEEKPEPKEQKEPEPAKEEQEAPEPKERPPKPDESETRQKEMNEAFESLHNPNRPTNDDAPEGSKKGVVGGSISDEAMANLMGTFQAKLIEAISKRWQVPTTIPEDQLSKLKGTVAVYVRLSESGHVVSYRFIQRSGNEQFNSSIERVLRQFQVSGGGATLPLPENKSVRKTVLERGLNLKNWEYTGR